MYIESSFYFRKLTGLEPGPCLYRHNRLLLTSAPYDDKKSNLIMIEFRKQLHAEIDKIMDPTPS